nr:hypothetical protein [uncultured Cohaesibacter sp.]
MKEQPQLTLRIETEDPIELRAFVGAFTSLASEFERQIKDLVPDGRSEGQIYVREVRKGSIEADLLPYLTALAPFIAHLDQALIVDQFVETWGRRISALISGELEGWVPSKNDLKTIADATEAIACDPMGSSTLEAVYFKDGKRQVTASFKFSTPEAKQAQKTIDAQYKLLDQSENETKERLLMVFTRTDVGNAKVGKRSGERVLIEELSNKPLAIMYSSELAEERIKHEIREAEGNVYKKGFVVDVNVKTVNQRPSVYAITNVHTVLDLPDDE